MDEIAHIDTPSKIMARADNDGVLFEGFINHTMIRRKYTQKVTSSAYLFL